MNNNFNDYEAGDEVIVVSHGWGATKYTKNQIDRTTRTQIVVGNTKFRKDNGKELGTQGRNIDYLLPVTEDSLKKVEEYQQSLIKYHLVKDLGSIDWDSYTIDELRSVTEFLENL